MTTRCALCLRPRFETSRYCEQHTNEILRPRVPEWVRRAQEKRLPVKDWR